MSISSIIQPPRTLLEVYKKLPEGTRAQLIENQLVMSPSPLYIHQKIIVNIFLALGVFVKEHQLGEVLVAPMDVYLDEQNIFQPDILFISHERLNIIAEDGLHGAPDLVIEVLSPSNEHYDQQQKKAIYEKYGVREYWMIDPKTKSTQGFILTNNLYEALPEEKGLIRSRLLGTTFNF